MTANIATNAHSPRCAKYPALTIARVLQHPDADAVRLPAAARRAEQQADAARDEDERGESLGDEVEGERDRARCDTSGTLSRSTKNTTHIAVMHDPDDDAEPARETSHRSPRADSGGSAAKPIPVLGGADSARDLTVRSARRTLPSRYTRPTSMPVRDAARRVCGGRGAPARVSSSTPPAAPIAAPAAESVGEVPAGRERDLALARPAEARPRAARRAHGRRVAVRALPALDGGSPPPGVVAREHGRARRSRRPSDCGLSSRR